MTSLLRFLNAPHWMGMRVSQSSTPLPMPVTLPTPGKDCFPSPPLLSGASAGCRRSNRTWDPGSGLCEDSGCGRPMPAMTWIVFLLLPPHLCAEGPPVASVDPGWRRRRCCAPCASSSAARAALLQLLILWTVLVSLFSLYALLVFRQLELKYHTRRVLPCQLSN